MGQAGIQIFITLATLIELVFASGIVIFIFQYHKHKLIHEREKAVLNEQHFQDILHTKLEIQNQTMQDIGREIHDNIGQKLTLASIYANKMSYENKFPQQHGQISTIGVLLSESIDELRSLSKNLTNQAVEIAELKALVEYECKRVNDLNVCKLVYSFNEAEYNMSNTIKNFILRIIQEFVQNSLKHSRCRNISLQFTYSEPGLSMRIQDDGVGFSMPHQEERKNKGIGLLNMKKRAELIGAEFSFTSIINEGTNLALFIPDKQLNSI
jgi:signal transduction histidine kinase